MILKASQILKLLRLDFTTLESNYSDKHFILRVNNCKLGLRGYGNILHKMTYLCLAFKDSF